MFSGELILFFCLGILAMLFAVGLIKFNKVYNFNWLSWLLSVLGIFLVIFTIAWSVSSALEGEPRAASMGIVFFGIPALVLIILARRVAIKNKKVVE